MGILHDAAFVDNVDIVRYLVEEKNMNMHATTKGDLHTPLHYAAAKNSYNVAKDMDNKEAEQIFEEAFDKLDPMKIDNRRMSKREFLRKIPFPLIREICM